MNDFMDEIWDDDELDAIVQILMIMLKTDKEGTPEENIARIKARMNNMVTNANNLNARVEEALRNESK